MIPNDTELQRMSDEQLERLFELRHGSPENIEWVRVAKELAHRSKFPKRQSPARLTGRLGRSR